jgi:enoyl-CoA hydratase/carnithine racemase
MQEAMMSYQHLKIEKKDRIAVVRINRPENGNTLSVALMEELIQAAVEFHNDVDTRVVVLTGSGQHFSLGIDLKDPKHIDMAGGPLLKRQRQFSLGPRLIRALFEIDQITIAAVNGMALGGGACIAAALDFRIGTENCQIGYPEVNLGIPLSWAALPMCVHLMGPARAKRFVILGRRENSRTLLEWGFLDEVVPDETLMDRTLEAARMYAAQAPISAQMIKRSINTITSYMDQAIMHMDGDQVLLAQTTSDFEEGFRAVFEKRRPEFKGE